MSPSGRRSLNKMATGLVASAVFALLMAASVTADCPRPGKTIVCYAQDAAVALRGDALCKCTHLVVPYANTETQDDDVPSVRLDEGTQSSYGTINSTAPRGRITAAFEKSGSRAGTYAK